MRTASKIIADLAKDTARDIKRMKERVANLRANKEALALSVAIAKHVVKGMKPEDVRVYDYVDSYDGELTVTIYREVDSLRDDPILLTILDRVNDFYFRVETDDYVSENLAERTFTFKRDGLRIKVEAQVNNPDKAEGCRRVQVGEEVRVMPKYAIVCD